MDGRGLSTMLAVILLVALVVAAAGFMAAYSWSYMQRAGNFPALAFTDVELVKDGRTALTVTLRNMGRLPLTLLRLELVDDTGARIDVLSLSPVTSGSNPMQPGDTFSVSYVGDLSVTPGKAYVLIAVTDKVSQQVTVYRVKP